jgi:hypothetical protein
VVADIAEVLEEPVVAGHQLLLVVAAVLEEPLATINSKTNKPQTKQNKTKQNKKKKNNRIVLFINFFPLFFEETFQQK